MPLSNEDLAAAVAAGNDHAQKIGMQEWLCTSIAKGINPFANAKATAQLKGCGCTRQMHPSKEAKIQTIV